MTALPVRVKYAKSMLRTFATQSQGAKSFDQWWQNLLSAIERKAKDLQVAP